MMQVLIVVTHPEPTSFNSLLVRHTQETLESRGNAVRVSDLYVKHFDPVEHPRHFLTRKDPLQFDVQTEQRFNSERHSLPTDVQREIADVLWADFIMLQFPLWWFGMPAMLKGWMDRVFAYGTLYSSRHRFDTGICSGKRVMLSVTTGSSAEACSHDGREGDTKLILWPIHYALHYLGFTVLEPILIHGVRRWVGEEDDGGERRQALQLALQSHCRWMEEVDEVPIIAFNGDGDWDEKGKLKENAPSYSPFIGHRLSSASAGRSLPRVRVRRARKLC